MQVPTGSWFEEPLTVVEAAGILLCENAACDAKAKEDFMATMQKMSQLNQEMRKETDTQQCNNCYKVGEKMLRCSRCKATFYCSKDCQKRAWVNHHKRECVPAES